MDSGRVEFPKELIRGFSQGTCQMIQFFFCGPTIIVRADLEFPDEGFYCGSTIVSSQLDPRMTGRCCCRRSGSRNFFYHRLCFYSKRTSRWIITITSFFLRCQIRFGISRRQRGMFTGSGFSDLSCRCRTCSSRRKRLKDGSRFTKATLSMHVFWTRDSRPFPFSCLVAHQTESSVIHLTLQHQDSLTLVFKEFITGISIVRVPLREMVWVVIENRSTVDPWCSASIDGFDHDHWLQ